jgi:NADP-dependent aldehyde dehydrogenase
MPRSARASLLREFAQALENRRADVVRTADRETALGEARLNSELTRTVFQFRFFADVVDDGGYLEATIDTAGDTPMGPRPDLRRLLIALGPVAVFGASNFPLAFSVPGGDTVSALAGGNPVVVKAHSSHPATARLAFDILAETARAAGAPDGVLGIVFGRDAGRALVAHPAVRAVGFTGSFAGGRALQRIIEERAEPIPFYGELSGLNPLVVTRHAAAEDAERIGSGFATSVTGSAGQLCTKPGLAFVPAGPAGDAVVAAAAEAVRAAVVVPLLNERVHAAYDESSRRLAELPGATVAAGRDRPAGAGFQAGPLLLTIDAEAAPAFVFEECFGPAAVIVRYRTEEELGSLIGELPASLTATVHTGTGPVPVGLVRALEALAGRIVFNGFPTGVAVSWAQHHGGPWPATTSLHTSVGATAIRRFLRPLTWQNAPAEVLPEELRDGPAGVPRRVDGVLRLPG